MNGLQDPLYVEDDVPLRDEVSRRCAVESVTGHTTLLAADLPPGYPSYFLMYDSAGHRIRQEEFNADGRRIRQWLYGSEGRLCEEVAYDGSGKIEYRWEIVYAGGHWNERRVYDTQGKVSYTIFAQRSPESSLLAAMFYDASGQTIRSDSYVYNDLGLLVRVDIGRVGKRTFEYDEQNNLTKRSTSLPGASVYGDTDEFHYDNRGLLSKKVHLHHNATSFSWDFLA